MLFPGVRMVRAVACLGVLAALTVVSPACLEKSTMCNNNTCVNTVTVKLQVPYDYAGLDGKSVEVCRGALCEQFKFPPDSQDASDIHLCSASVQSSSCEVHASAATSEISIGMRVDPPFPKGDLYHVTFRDDATGAAEIDAYRAVTYTYSLLTPGHPECGGCAGAEMDLQPGAPHYADCSGTCN